MSVEAILSAIPRLSALVVGDVCLDRWCHYEPRYAEPSRETGIPRVAVTAFKRTPGGAGTVASNLAALGTGRVTVLGVVGEDGHGYELRRALEEKHIDASELLTVAGVPTFTYTKLIDSETGREDLPRVDFVNACELSAAVQDELVARFRRLAGQVDVVIVSDQSELQRGGVVTAALRLAISEFAGAQPRTVVWVDSRTRGDEFRGVLVKLNEEEAAHACARLGPGADYEVLRRHIGHATLIVTRGPQGAVVITAKSTTTVAALHVPSPVDICGAGDSFNAGAALALRITNDPVAATRFGNLVASITVMKSGTGTASPGEVLSASQRSEN